MTAARDTVPPPSLCAAWLVAGAMDAGIDLWMSGDRVTWHGPSEARKRWARIMHTFETPLAVYLRREVYPAKSNEAKEG
jgi:hypothetical protein